METQTKGQTISESLGWILFTLRMSARRRRQASTINHSTMNHTSFLMLDDGQLLLPGVAEPHRWTFGGCFSGGIGHEH